MTAAHGAPSAEQLRAWMDRSLPAVGDALVLLSGSVAAGLGNAMSDLDIYIVRGDDECSYDGAQFFEFGRRIDCHDLPLARVIGLIEAAEAHRESGRTFQLSSAGELYRITHGVHVAGPRIDDDTLRRGTAALKGVLRRLAAERIIDVWTTLCVAGDLTDEARRAELATQIVEEILFGALVDREQLYPNLKWSWEKLRACDDAADVEDALVRCVHALRGPAWDQSAARDAVVSTLDAVGISVELPNKPWRPARRADLRVFPLGMHHLLEFDGVLVEAAPSATFLIGLLEGAMTVTELERAVAAAFPGARSRIAEDVRIALQTMHARELLGPVGAVADPLIDAFAERFEHPFEPSLGPPVTASTFVARSAQVWRTWVDFLSVRDDMSGALDAGQHGAAVAAARAAVRQAVTILLLSQGVQVPAGKELGVLRAAVGAESAPYRTVRRLLRHSRVDEDLSDFVLRVKEFCEEVTARPEVLLTGGLRDEADHFTLFASLHDVVHVADALDIPVPIAPAIIAKAHAIAEAGQQAART